MKTNSRIIKSVLSLVCLIAVFITGCQLLQSKETVMDQTFGDDLDFLRDLNEIVLSIILSGGVRRSFFKPSEDICFFSGSNTPIMSPKVYPK